MAPALTETATDGHGVHLSSPLPSSAIAPDTAILGKESGTSQQKLMGNSDAQSAWIKLTYPHSPNGSSDDVMGLEHTPFGSPQASGHYKTVLLASTNSLLNLLSLNKNLNGGKHSIMTCPRGSCKDISDHPNVFYVSVPDIKRKVVPKVCEKTGPNFRQESAPDADAVMNSSQTTNRRHSVSESNASAKGPFTFLMPTKINGSLGRVPALHGSAVKVGFNAKQWDSDEARDVILTNCTDGKETGTNRQLFQCLTKHQTLVNQASKIQKRLQILLGEHAAEHCSNQIGGLVDHHLRSKAFRSSAGTGPTCSPLVNSSFDHSEVEQGPFKSNQNDSMPTRCTLEVQEFACSVKAVLSRVEETLDSDATGSSSDEEWEQELATGKRNLPVNHTCEWRWLSERAEIGSRWTWLQARISDLEYKIQQLSDLHTQIHSTKGRVILEDSQPLSDRLIQQMLLTETAGLLNTARDNTTPAEIEDFSLEHDFEMEPSSPTHLLRNIERQSAQLTEIVSSLIPPLSFSPSSSPVSSKPCSWKGQSKSKVESRDVFSKRISCVSGQHSIKKRRVSKRKPRVPHINSTCVSARTRPLRTYQKRRLFSLDSQKAELPPAAPCQCNSHYDHHCESVRMTKTEQIGLLESSVHPVLSVSSDVPLPLHLHTLLQQEDWVNRPIPPTEDVKPSVFTSGGNEMPALTTLIDCGYGEDHYSKLHGWAGQSAIHRPQNGQETPRQLYREGRKRRHSHEEPFLSKLMKPPFYLPPYPEDSASDIMTSKSTLSHKQPTQNSARRRLRSECFYDIDNIVIPMSLAATSKVEKLQYKDIITPSWRVVDIQPLEGIHLEEEEVEDLADQSFFARHVKCEDKEKKRWTFWEQNRWHRQNSRSSSKSSSCTLHPLHSPWNCTAGATQNMPSTQGDCTWQSTAPNSSALEEDDQDEKFILPWESRIFPLDDQEVEALKPHKVSPFEEQTSQHLRTFSCSSDGGVYENTSGTSACTTIAPPAGDPLHVPKEERHTSSGCQNSIQNTASYEAARKQKGYRSDMLAMSLTGRGQHIERDQDVLYQHVSSILTV
ncbi:KAT8 regulatory NSL complex subunit 1-like protein [Acipenser ruthenus]|uniref:KAT8 regulatory NSL complex subunit 1-like protein n=1 Tax=Acipenser ruthenus TaxID=7906 RepID=UPI00274282EA|nr:KAT8 regulatory NSL complex subunit 1-like protein [Acipenser ruthenus]XP_058890020.1 KAT8 regulatory NSL complex subunit 1-like protein [Acipenser ruthenus]